MAPFGSLLAGTMAHVLPTTTAVIHGLSLLLTGAQLTVIINGSFVVLAALWFFSRLPALRHVVRPIYQEMGILPAAKEMAAEQVQS